jgi:hypothetical protein
MSELFTRLPRLKAIRTREELESVHGAAELDGHGLLAPTHVVLKDNVIAGAFSIGGAMLVTMWLDSERLQARQSFSLINTVENITAETMRLRGQPAGAVLVEKSSPFYAVMGGMGYQERGEFVLFTKEV